MKVVNNRLGEEAMFTILEMLLCTCPIHFSRVPFLTTFSVVFRTNELKKN